jgi:hypothetical protein
MKTSQWNPPNTGREGQREGIMEGVHLFQAHCTMYAILTMKFPDIINVWWIKS